MVTFSTLWAAALVGLLTAPPAFGAFSCTHNGAGTPVSILINGDNPGNQTLRIEVDSGDLVVTDETSVPVSVPCGPDFSPDLDEVTVVNLTDVSFNDGDTTLTVSQAGGRYEPGSGLEAGIAEIEFNVNLGGGNDTLSLLPRVGAFNDTFHAGDSDATATEDNGINVNNDDDIDIDVGGTTENFRFNGDTPNSAETGTDVIRADGTPGAGQAAYPQPLGYNNLNIFGGGGPDTLASGATGGQLAGEPGDDTLLGGAGLDTMRPAAGNDTVIGGNGTDTVSYFGSPAGVRVDLAITSQQDTIGAGLDTITDTERLQGSVFGDVLIGNDDDNDFINDGDIAAVFADDVLIGRFGNDSLLAERGDDTVIGGQGNDILRGGDGIDTVSYDEDSVGPVTVDLGLVAAQPTGGAGIDTLQDTFENLTGSPFEGDLLTGNALPNFIDVRDGFGDTITCLDPAAPPPADQVRADQATLDSVNADCETVDFLAEVIPETPLTPDTPVTPVTPGPGPGGPATGKVKCKKPKKKAGKAKKKCKRKKGKRKT